MIGTGSLSGTRSAVFSFHVQYAYRCCFARFHLALPINTVYFQSRRAHFDFIDSASSGIVMMLL